VDGVNAPKGLWPMRPIVEHSDIGFDWLDRKSVYPPVIGLENGAKSIEG